MALAKNRLLEYGGLLEYFPHPKQLKFHMMPQSVKSFVGGNRSGKTMASMYEAAWTATGFHPFWENSPEPPVKIRVCGPDYPTVIERVNLPMIKKILPPGSYNWRKEARTLELVNGSEIFFQSYDQTLDKYGGQSLHLIIEDEEPPERIHNENLMRILDTDGRLIMAYTPIFGISWSFDKIFMNEEKDPETGLPAIGKVFVKTRDNPYISNRAIQKLKLQIKDPAELEARLEGAYFSKSGLCIPQFDRDIHVVSPLMIPPQTQIVMGIDHHTRNPEAVVMIKVDTDNNLWAYAEVYEVGIVSKTAAAIKERLEGEKPRLTIIDVNANTPDAITGRSAKSEYAKHGIHTLVAKKGHGSVNEGIEVLQEYFGNNQLFITEACPNLINQLCTYRWEEWTTRTRDRRDPKERPIQRNIHLVDGLRYIVQTRPRYRSAAAVRLPKQVPRSKKTGYI